MNGCCRYSDRLIPLRTPVNKRPVFVLEKHTSYFPDQAFFGQMVAEIFQDPVHTSEMLPHQRRISEIHHVIMNHQDIENRKAGDHVHTLRRRRCLQDPVAALGPAEGIHALACQPVIRRHRISEQDLRSGIHGILQLFVKGTIHIGLMHASLKRA